MKRKNLFLGELYSATSNEPVFGVNDPLIQRSFTEGKQLRTQQHDSNWLRSKFYFQYFSTNVNSRVFSTYGRFSSNVLKAVGRTFSS